MRLRLVTSYKSGVVAIGMECGSKTYLTSIIHNFFNGVRFSGTRGSIKNLLKCSFGGLFFIVYAPQHIANGINITFDG